MHVLTAVCGFQLFVVVTLCGLQVFEKPRAMQRLAAAARQQGQSACACMLAPRSFPVDEAAVHNHPVRGCCALLACRVERAVAGSSSSQGADGRGSDETDPVLSTAIADLHKFSMMQSMYKSVVHLLDDLSAHAKRLDMPERAQVLLAAAQNPLLGEHHFAKALLPRLCSLILGAHKATRHVSARRSCWQLACTRPLAAIILHHCSCAGVAVGCPVGLASA
jgi:hypothetical protein